MLAPVVIIVGSEQYGLNNFWLENADQKVKINMRGSADSLNAAISTAIVLYESLRQNKL
jgi:TrmH family RNA methyltransferase